MDLANNQRGASVAETLTKNSKFSDEGVSIEFKKQLNEGKLIVLKKRQKG